MMLMPVAQISFKVQLEEQTRKRPEQLCAELVQHLSPKETTMIESPQTTYCVSAIFSNF